MQTKTRYAVICDGLNWYFAINQDEAVYNWRETLENEYLRETYKRGFNKPDTKFLELSGDRRAWANMLKATGGNFDREPVLRDIFQALLSHGL